MNWGDASWAEIASEDPQFLVLLDLLEHHPVPRDTDAVRSRRFRPLRYEQLMPGPADVDAVLARPSRP